jgi:hypothetical protein
MIFQLTYYFKGRYQHCLSIISQSYRLVQMCFRGPPRMIRNSGFQTLETEMNSDHARRCQRRILLPFTLVLITKTCLQMETESWTHSQALSLPSAATNPNNLEYRQFEDLLVFLDVTAGKGVNCFAW